MLNLKPNANTGIIPCMPCCNHVYQECGCPVNQRLNEIGSNPEIEKSVPRKYATFFIHGLFAGDSLSFDRYYRNDGVFNDGANAYSVQCSGPWFSEDGLAADIIWTFGFTSQFTSIPPGRTLAAYVRFNAASKTFSAKIVLDGVDPGWSDVTKTFSNEYMATLQGSSGGYTFISHSLCLCSDYSVSRGYIPYLTDAEIGEKTLHVSFAGMPACLKKNYEINKKFIEPNLTLFNGAAGPQGAAELARYRINYPLAGSCGGRANTNWSYDAVFQFGSQTQMPYCLSNLLTWSFFWTPDTYTGYVVEYPYSLDHVENRQALTFTALSENSGYQIGTKSPWNTGMYSFPPFGIKRPGYYVGGWVDTSYELFIDFEPLFIRSKGAGINYIADDYMNQIRLDGQSTYGSFGTVDLLEVTITE